MEKLREYFLSTFILSHNKSNADSASEECQRIAVEFKEWCERNEANVDFQEEHNHTAQELFDIFLTHKFK